MILLPLIRLQAEQSQFATGLATGVKPALRLALQVESSGTPAGHLESLTNNNQRPSGASLVPHKAELDLRRTRALAQWLSLAGFA